jgi:hypothetical protein
MLLSFLFFVVNVFDTASYVSIDPWYHSFYPLSSSFSRRKDPTPPSFHSQRQYSSSNDPILMPWIDATRPPHRTAMQWQYQCMISL